MSIRRKCVKTILLIQEGREPTLTQGFSDEKSHNGASSRTRGIYYEKRKRAEKFQENVIGLQKKRTGVIQIAECKRFKRLV